MRNDTVFELDASLQQRLNEIMIELHELVSRLQLPKMNAYSWKEQAMEHCREMCRSISDLSDQLSRATTEAENMFGEQMDRLCRQYDKKLIEKKAKLLENLKTVEKYLNVYASALSESTHQQTLKSIYKSLSGGYEDLVVELTELRREGLINVAAARHLKPVKFIRNGFHVLMGLTAYMLYMFFLSREQALIVLFTILSVFGSLEITRRFSGRWNDFLVDRVFGLISRPHERTATNGSTWYVIALILIVAVFPQNVVLAAVLTLALADPAASIAGKLLGKKKIKGEKTYVGSLFFLVISFLVCLPFAYSANLLWMAIPAALFVALTTTLAELLITKIDDNFTIPLVCACAAWLVF